MKIRIAKPRDAQEIANLHIACSKVQPDGFMYQLGTNFLKTYYSILLKEKYSLVLCAENDDGIIIGIVTGSMNSQEHALALTKEKINIAISALNAIVLKPILLKEMYERSKPNSADSSEKGFIVLTGPRLEYWGWDPKEKQTLGAVELLRTWLETMKLLGVTHITNEVDESNKKSLRLHELLGAKIIKSYNTPDGRKRYLMEYNLTSIK
jgi:hypothetical protein